MIAMDCNNDLSLDHFLHPWIRDLFRATNHVQNMSRYICTCVCVFCLVREALSMIPQLRKCWSATEIPSIFFGIEEDNNRLLSSSLAFGEVRERLEKFRLEYYFFLGSCDRRESHSGVKRTVDLVQGAENLFKIHSWSCKAPSRIGITLPQNYLADLSIRRTLIPRLIPIQMDLIHHGTQ